MKTWTQIPDNKVIEETAAALAKNNIETFVVETGDEAKKKFFELLPEGSEVMVNYSLTLKDLGIASEVNDSGRYKPLKDVLSKMDSKIQGVEKRRVGSGMQYACGSAHAVTQDGRVMMTSGSGSQIPGYAYGAEHIIWVIGAHKIVKDIDEGLKRIYEHSWPLENERMKKYGGSNPRRILTFNNENEGNKERTKEIIVKEVLGF